MENNLQTPEQNDVQQQINELKSKNDKLLHKYVELRTKGIAGDRWLFFFFVQRVCRTWNLGAAKTDITMGRHRYYLDVVALYGTWVLYYFAAT